MTGSVVVVLLPSEVWAVTEPTESGGGFQDYLAELQGRLERNRLTLSSDEIERIRRYAEDYGEGGWQDRYRVIAAAIDRALGAD